MAPCSWNMLPWWYVCILTIKWCVRLNDSRIHKSSYTSGWLKLNTSLTCSVQRHHIITSVYNGEWTEVIYIHLWLYAKQWSGLSRSFPGNSLLLDVFDCTHWGYFSAFVIVMMNILVLWWLAARKDGFVVNVLVIWILRIEIHVGGNEYDGFKFSEADRVKYMCTYTLYFAWNIYFGILYNFCLRLFSFQDEFFDILL